MAYRVEIARAAFRDLAALPHSMRSRTRDAIDGLADEPRPFGSLKLTGREGYRLRIGDYRVLYEIDDSASTVAVTRVLHRRDAYR